MTDKNERCVYCGQNERQVPLIAFKYQDQQLWICSQHLPILIHKPDQLAVFLPGMGAIAPAEHED